MNQNALTVKTRTGTLTVTPWKITIAAGSRNYKDILISEITSIRYIGAGLFSPGRMHFSFRGGTEWKPGLVNQITDENTVTFKRKQEPDILRAKELIEYYQSVPRPLDYRSR